MLRWLAALAIALSFADAAAAKPLPRDAAPSASSGYVGGDFQITFSVFALAFVVTNQDTGKTYLVPFSTGPDRQARREETTLVEVPPGRYRVSAWIAYRSAFGTSFLGKEVEQAVKTGQLAEPFEVRVGEVVFLGGFIADSNYTPFVGRSEEGWKRSPTTLTQAKALIGQMFPAFASAAIRCPACVG